MTDPAVVAPPPESDVVDGDIFTLQRVGGRGAIDWLLGLQRGDRLATWSVSHDRTEHRLAPRMAMELPDRPLAAGFYEGPEQEDPSDVTEVTIEDRGLLHVMAWGDDEIRIELVGCAMQGRYRLRRVRAEQWQFARMGDLEDKESWHPLEFVTMMHSELMPVDDEVNWAFEPCWPGLRAMYERQDGRSVLRDAEGEDRLGSLGELAGLAPAAGAEQLLLDGVVLVLDSHHRPDPDALRARLAGSTHAPVVYVVFDVVQIDGRPLQQCPLRYRRERLEALELSGSHWLTTPQWTDTSRDAALEAASSYGMGGIIAKRRGSPYRANQTGNPWRRILG